MSNENCHYSSSFVVQKDIIMLFINNLFSKVYGEKHYGIIYMKKVAQNY